jgi:hypothetical protein
MKKGEEHVYEEDIDEDENGDEHVEEKVFSFLATSQLNDLCKMYIINK